MAAPDIKQEPMLNLPKVGKLPKPLVERRRRARINASVDALREILPTTHADARTDKADVLEMAVNHLKQLRKRRREARDKRARTAQLQGLGPVNTEEKSFRKGYSECLSEVAKMMMFSPAIDDNTRQKLIARLTTVSCPPNPPPRLGAQSPVSCGATPPHSPGYPSPPSSPGARTPSHLKVCGSPPLSGSVASPGRVPGLIKPKPQIMINPLSGFPKVLSPAIQAALQARLAMLTNPHKVPTLSTFIPKPGTLTAREELMNLMSQPLSERTRLPQSTFNSLPLWRPW
ncbi:hypothetical protein ACHWQZ_G018385 [Mnemiopsis leidyi]